MTDYFYIYGNDRKPPYTSGIVLKDVKDPEIILTLNGTSKLNFSYPYDGDPRAELLQVNNIVAYQGKGYRIRRRVDTHTPDKVPMIQVNAEDFMADLNDYVLPEFFMIGKTPYEMMTAALGKTPFHVMTKSETKEKGLEWWDVPTDLDLGRTTPSNVITQIIALTGGGEIYLDGYNIALVKAIGRKAIYPIMLGNNLKSLERAVDGKGLITRMYPMGQDDLHIDYVTEGNVQYIDSRWQEVFGVVEGYAEYTDIKALGEDDADSADGASLLYWTACANMDAPIHCGNDKLKEDKNRYVNTTGMKHKVDVPKIEYRIAYRELEILRQDKNFAYHIGDVIRIIDQAFGVDTGRPGEKDYLNLEQQVIEKVIYPQDPRKNTVRLGQDKVTVMAAIYAGKASNEYIKANTDKDNNIKESSVEGTEQVDVLTIEPAGNNRYYVTDRFGVRSIGHVYYDDYRNPRYAVCISKSVIAMGKKVDGKWQWSNVIAQGMGNIDGGMWAGQIYTDNLVVQSKDGNLMIEGTAITMRDKNETIRFKVGLDPSDKLFKFVLCDAEGNPTVYIDSNGDVVFAGTVNTKKDCNVGQYLYVGQGMDDGCIYISTTNDPTAASIRNTADGETIISGNKGGDIVFGDYGVCIDNDRSGNVIVTQDDMEKLKTWVKENFEPKQKK